MQRWFPNLSGYITPITPDNAIGNKVCSTFKCELFIATSWYEDGKPINGPEGWHRREYEDGKVICQYTLMAPGIYIRVNNSGETIIDWSEVGQ